MLAGLGRRPNAAEMPLCLAALISTAICELQRTCGPEDIDSSHSCSAIGTTQSENTTGCA